MAEQKDEKRSKEIELLWQLRQLLKSEQNLNVSFARLMNDLDYKIEVLRRAEDSGHPELARIVQELRHSAGFSSQHQAAPAKAVSAPAAAKESSQMTEDAPVKAKSSNAVGGMIFAVVILAVLGAAVGYLWTSSSGSFFAFSKPGDGKAATGGIVEVNEDIVKDTTWTSDKTYILKKIIFVEGSADLTIQPGTLIKGDPGSALIVTRDAKIFARGRKNAPIVFTSNQPVGSRATGDWGGVVLLGNAPLNRPQAQIEGLDDKDTRGLYGGSDKLSNCGVMEYVRIEFAGFKISQDNELNGLTLGGCSSTSVMRYIQIHRGSDDGIEVYGGDVNFKYIVITGAQDDGFDWDKGYIGNVQFGIIQQYLDSEGTAFEGDSGGSARHDAIDPDSEPRSVPSFYNMVLVGSRNNPKRNIGMVVRSGSGMRFQNSIVMNFPGVVADPRGEATGRLIGTENLVLSNNIFWNMGADGKTFFLKTEEEKAADADNVDEAKVFLAPEQKNRLIDPLLERPDSVTNPDWAPLPGSPVSLGETAPIVSKIDTDFWDKSANYIGVMRQGGVKWWEGWTAFPEN
jgi:hypothetical protein